MKWGTLVWHWVTNGLEGMGQGGSASELIVQEPAERARPKLELLGPIFGAPFGYPKLEPPFMLLLRGP